MYLILNTIRSATIKPITKQYIRYKKIVAESELGIIAPISCAWSGSFCELDNQYSRITFGFILHRSGVRCEQKPSYTAFKALYATQQNYLKSSFMMVVPKTLLVATKFSPFQMEGLITGCPMVQSK